MMELKSNEPNALSNLDSIWAELRRDFGNQVCDWRVVYESGSLRKLTLEILPKEAEQPKAEQPKASATVAEPAAQTTPPTPSIK